jgi:hypothetical protein
MERPLPSEPAFFLVAQGILSTLKTNGAVQQLRPAERRGPGQCPIISLIRS